MAVGIKIYFGGYTFSYDLDKGFSWRSSFDEDVRPRVRVPDTNSLVASEATIRAYLSDQGVENIKSIKFVEPKFPKHKAAKRCNCILEYFAEDVADGRTSAEYFRDRLNKYCGVDIEY